MIIGTSDVIRYTVQGQGRQLTANTLKTLRVVPCRLRGLGDLLGCIGGCRKPRTMIDSEATDLSSDYLERKEPPPRGTQPGEI